jgi:hypothetical protein
MDHAFLMGVLHAFADAQEQFQAAPQVEAGSVAILGDRAAFDELHREERRAVGRGAGIEDLRDGRVLHLRQHLALDLEMGELARIEPVPAQQFERHRAVHRFELVGTIDLAHAAAPEQGLDPIAPDALAGRQGIGRRRGGGVTAGDEPLGGRGIVARSRSVHRPTPCAGPATV